MPDFSYPTYRSHLVFITLNIPPDFFPEDLLRGAFACDIIIADV